ncbi:glycine-rich cell wall structural protein 1.0-like [Panicum virgatum]|uniref:glycine-rich cell wall structural protein 1.0-like n=1 Tax=Panicum virgatum TaxID=38727 RepID=UPI0019D6495A|nr:glycine-rich cell wall structural protein 1.0-like [Panicum virgatum]
MTSVRRLGSSWNVNAEKVLGGATTEPAVSRPSRSMEVDADMASSGADGVAGGGNMGVEGTKIAGSDGVGVDGAGDGGGITVKAPGGDGTGADGVGVTGTGGEGAGGGSPGEDAGGATGAAGDCGVGEGAGETTGVACGDGVDGACRSAGGVGDAGVGGETMDASIPMDISFISCTMRSNRSEIESRVVSI